MNFFKKFLIIISFIIIFLIIINLFDYSLVTTNNQWISKDGTMISAHRGGAQLNPENTMKAFKHVINEVDYVDIIELDVRTSKDDHLVIIHDETINRVALEENENDVYVNDLTLDELSQYNLGKNFINLEGVKPYKNYTLEECKNQGLTIITLEDFLNEFYDDDFKLLLEIKEKGEEGKKAADKAIELLSLSKYNDFINRTMIISFSDEVMDYIANKYGDKVQTGPLGYKIIGFVATSLLRINLFYKPNYICLQVQPTQKLSFMKFNFANKTLVDAAHKRNMAITYWTVNDEEEMKKLIDLKADIITTNSPDILYKVLKEKGLR